MRSVADVVEIGVFIPPMPDEGRHHVVSRGQKPDFYRPEDLKDKGLGKTAWVDAFEKVLVGLYLRLRAPVPYAFRTPDGQIRSLDAGCIKMLANRTPPEVELSVDDYGYIDTLRPSQALLDRYAQISDRLVQRIVQASPED